MTVCIIIIYEKKTKHKFILNLQNHLYGFNY